jgi:23S rRNA pseudouridine1911/1915/1917 synthase
VTSDPPPPEPLTLVLGPEAAGLRLDRALADRFPEASRTAVASWIEEGRVRVDGAPLEGRARVRGGECVEVRVPPPRPTDLVPEDLPVVVLYEDEHVLVLDKPSGLTVHPGSGRASGTLANALVHRLKDLPTPGGADRPGIVHRLDKDTSGVMVVAKTEPAHRALSRAFAAREVEKEYLAVVHGVPAAPSGRIDRPLGRSSAGRTRMAVREGGREATTEWRVEEALPRHALLRCRPRTGRTHQIRVHLRDAGHPIVGDPLYGWRSSPGDALPGRLLLHAHRLAFPHPATGEVVRFEAPPPPDFLAGVAALRAAPPPKRRRGRS